MKKDTLKTTCTYQGSEASDATAPQPALTPAPLERTEGYDGIRSYGNGLPSVFAGEVNAEVDARSGYRSTGKPNLIPMTDAPIFGFICHRRTPDSSAHHQDHVLPPRRHADYLMELYWRHIQPLEPFLDQERFIHSYQALFAGTPLNEDERTFVASLNTVFALSTQLQEGMEPIQREETSNTYFQRAWALLCPETVMWGSGSLEIVQCLLLIARYLQCTSNPHQAWMAVGSAVRIAQSLGLHLSESFTASSPGRDSRMRRRLWECCVFMDR